jgi:diaminopimelate decarboxylase
MYVVTEDEVVGWVREQQHQIETPLYLYDASALSTAAARLATALPQGTRLFYSLKANPQPAVIRHFFGMGIHPEIASVGERYACTLAGVPASDILVGGVGKSSGYLGEIIAGGCHALVIDSLSEWARVKGIRPGRPGLRILIRLAPGVALGGLDMAGSSQFGVSEEQALSIASECHDVGVDFAGLHFYFGSQRLRPQPIVQALQVATDHLKGFQQAGVPVGIVDIGLGCGVPYLERDEALDHDVLRAQLSAVWADPVWRGIEIWSEAGRALVAQAGYFIARVTDIKRLHGKAFAFLDGGLNVHNPGVGLGRLLRSNPRFRFVTRDDRGTLEAMDLVGNLCTSADRLGQDVKAPPLMEGDLVLIPNSGAYTLTTGMWGFNSQAPFSEMMLDPDGTLHRLDPQPRVWSQVAAWFGQAR